MKGFHHKLFFITCFLYLYTLHFLIFVLYFSFVFKSALTQFFCCVFFNLVGMNQGNLQDFVLQLSLSVKHKVLSNCFPSEVFANWVVEFDLLNATFH